METREIHSNIDLIHNLSVALRDLDEDFAYECKHAVQYEFNHLKEDERKIYLNLCEGAISAIKMAFQYQAMGQ